MRCEIAHLASLVLAAALALGTLACDQFFTHASQGERLYRQRCARCHGIDGRGNTPQWMGDPYADLTDDAWRYGGDPPSIEDTIRDGIFSKMPPNKDLTPKQLKELTNYVLYLGGKSSGEP